MNLLNKNHNEPQNNFSHGKETIIELTVKSNPEKNSLSSSSVVPDFETLDIKYKEDLELNMVKLFLG